MLDERWHIQYVREALKGMEKTYGAEEIEQTLARHAAADEEVYGNTLAEFGERIAFLGETAHDLSGDGSDSHVGTDRPGTGAAVDAQK